MISTTFWAAAGIFVSQVNELIVFMRQLRPVRVVLQGLRQHFRLTKIPVYGFFVDA